MGWQEVALRDSPVKTLDESLHSHLVGPFLYIIPVFMVIMAFNRVESDVRSHCYHTAPGNTTLYSRSLTKRGEVILIRCMLNPSMIDGPATRSSERETWNLSRKSLTDSMQWTCRTCIPGAYV